MCNASFCDVSGSVGGADSGGVSCSVAEADCWNEVVLESSLGTGLIPG